MNTVIHGKFNHLILQSDFSCIKWWDYFKIKREGGFQRLTLKYLFQDVYNEFALKEIQIESGIFHSMYVLMVTSYYNHNENKQIRKNKKTNKQTNKRDSCEKHPNRD